MTAVRTLIRNCLKKQDEPYKIVTFLTDKFVDELLGLTEHEFYYWDINKQVSRDDLPDNFMPIYEKDLPIDLDVDLVLCRDTEIQYSISRKFCDFWHLPLIMMIDHYKQRAMRYNADLTIFSSYEIQESWGIVGAVVEPGFDANFATINHKCEAKRPLIISDIKHEKDTLFCRDIIKHTEFTVESCRKTKQERYEQYRKAQAFLNIYSDIYPIAAIEALIAGLPVISVPNRHLDKYVNDNMGVFFNTPIQAKGYLSHLDRMIVKPFEYRSTDDFTTEFNRVLNIFNDYIYIRG